MENRRSVFFMGELILELLWDFKHRSRQVPKSVFDYIKVFFKWVSKRLKRNRNSR